MGTIWERFVEKSPSSVLVRGLLERVLGAAHRDAWDERTAHQQSPRALFFSPVYALRSHVVFRLQPSGHAAYRTHEGPGGASLVAVENQRHGVETHTAAARVRDRATGWPPRIAPRGGPSPPWRPGARVTIVDGHGMEATAPRRKAWRALPGGALPGQAWVGYAPAQGLVTDVCPCEDGPAHERSVGGRVLDTGPAGDRWRPERTVGPWALLCGIAQRDAWCMPRQPAGLPDAIVRPFRAAGRVATGPVAEQRGGGRDAQGPTPSLRRIRVA